jgi:cytochrome P450
MKSCPSAQEVAVTAIKVVVTGLLRRFKFQLDPDRLEDPKPTSQIFFKPLNGIHLTVSRR